MAERRYAQFSITAESLRTMLLLPEDVSIVHAGQNERDPYSGMFRFIIESPSLPIPAHEEGRIMPEVSAVYQEAADGRCVFAHWSGGNG